MRPLLRTVALAVSAWLALTGVARADVHLSMRNGRVTLVAKDATVRQILAEWARVGKTKIVNGERIPGGPMTIELRDVPEAEALDVLLRTLSGYIVAPRVTLGPADTSVFESIAVMPTVASTARPPASSSAPAPFSPPPVFNQVEDDQQNPARPAPGAQQGRPPIFSTFPSPQQGARPVLPVVRPGIVPQQPIGLPQPAPAATPSGPVGVAAPGMIAPAPAQPGQTRPPNE